MLDRAIFILGTERSGSTWLGNILDASPETVFFMEPFAEYAKIFDGLPGRNCYLEASNPFLESILREGGSRLLRHKYPLPGDAPDASPLARSGARRLLLARARAAKWMRDRPPLAAVRYELLNLNRLNSDELWVLPKRSGALVPVVKELRLNLKVPFLREALPGARHVVIIRNPRSLIGSVMRLFERGSLFQLREALSSFTETALQTRRFEKYGAALAGTDADSLLARMIAYWFISYNTLLEDLDAGGAPYALVKHEDLCVGTEDVVGRLFADLGLEVSEPVRAYLQSSTRAGNEAASPLDTTRSSRTYHLESLGRVTSELETQFHRWAAPFWDLSHPVVQSYRDETSRRPAAAAV